MVTEDNELISREQQQSQQQQQRYNSNNNNRGSRHYHNNSNNRNNYQKNYNSGGSNQNRQRSGPRHGEERPKKEAILDLAKYQDKQVRVKFIGGREGKSKTWKNIRKDFKKKKKIKSEMIIINNKRIKPPFLKC